MMFRRLALILLVAAPLRAATGMGDGGGGRGAGGAAGAPSRSRLTTRPPGPLPDRSFRSTPVSRAMRLASGDALTRSSETVAVGTGVGVGGGAGRTLPPSPFPFPAAAAALASPTFSPGAPMYATTSPTGTVLPSGTRTFTRLPSARAISSITALSVSTSASVSPVFTGSPSFFVHLTRRPSSIVGESASMWTVVAIVSRGRGPGARPPRPSRGWLSRRAPGACCRASACPPG